MKAYPILIENSPMKKLLQAELPDAGTVSYNEEHAEYNAGTRRHIVQAIRREKNREAFSILSYL